MRKVGSMLRQPEARHGQELNFVLIRRQRSQTMKETKREQMEWTGGGFRGGEEWDGFACS